MAHGSQGENAALRRELDALRTSSATLWSTQNTPPRRAVLPPSAGTDGFDATFLCGAFGAQQQVREPTRAPASLDGSRATAARSTSWSGSAVPQRHLSSSNQSSGPILGWPGSCRCHETFLFFQDFYGYCGYCGVRPPHLLLSATPPCRCWRLSARNIYGGSAPRCASCRGNCRAPCAPQGQL